MTRKDYVSIAKAVRPVLISPEALQAMRARKGTWAAYQNIAMDSASLGHMRFLRYGPECTLKEPPQRHPDTADFIGWKYVYVGTVDLETGEVVKP